VKNEGFQYFEKKKQQYIRKTRVFLMNELAEIRLELLIVVLLSSAFDVEALVDIEFCKPVKFMGKYD
jgi:phosphatidate phosphatase PAH1